MRATFLLETSAAHFARWLQEKTGTVYSQVFPTEKGRINVQPVRSPMAITGPITLTMDAMYILPDDDDPGAERAYDIGPAIEFRLIPLSDTRVEVEVESSHAALAEYCEELIRKVTTTWPSTVQGPKSPGTQLKVESRGPQMSDDEVEYDVALSFAGEERSYVERVATELRTRHNIRVFYDKDADEDLWGKDLYTFFDEVFRKKSRFCIMFVSKNYRDKVWTKHERECAQARALQQKDKEYILPVRFDDSDIPGLRPTTRYEDATKLTPEEVAEKFAKKLRRQENPKREPSRTRSTGGEPGTIKVPDSTVQLSRRLMALLARHGFQWEPKPGDIVWCPSVHESKCTVVPGISPTNRDYFQDSNFRSHLRSDPDLVFIPRFMQLWAWYDQVMPPGFHLRKDSSKDPEFYAGVPVSGTRPTFSEGHSNCLDAMLGLLIRLSDEGSLDAGAYARAAMRSEEHFSLECNKLAEMLYVAKALRWDPLPGDRISTTGTDQLRILNGSISEGRVKIHPGKEVYVANVVWIPEPEQLLDTFEGTTPEGKEFDGFDLGPADLDGQLVHSVSTANHGMCTQKDITASGSDPQVAVLKLFRATKRS